MYLVTWADSPLSIVFFFQAEDGIRDLTVTGVQTCALPICGGDGAARRYLGQQCRTRRAVRSGRARARPRAARDRESGVEGKRVDLGGRRIIKKKKERQRMA